MEIISKLFGKIEYAKENIILMDEGLIGISDKKNYILIEKEDFKPFSYLQSIDDGSFILIVINPLLVEKEYKYSILQDDINALEIAELDPDSFSLLAIVIFSNRIEHITVNLKAPILVNVKTKRAKQIILLNDDYGVEEPLIRPSAPDIFQVQPDSNAEKKTHAGENR